MANKNVWSAALFTLGVLIVVAAVQIAVAAVPHNWHSGAFRALMIIGTGFVLASLILLIGALGSRPRLTIVDSEVVSSVFADAPTESVHFVRVLVSNDPRWGAETAYGVYAELEFSTLASELLLDGPIRGRWARLASPPTWSETHVAPTDTLFANGLRYPLDVAFQPDGKDEMFAYNDENRFAGAASRPLGTGPVLVTVVVAGAGVRAIRRTYTLSASDRGPTLVVRA